MKKVVIFYFSGTGNTWWATEMLAGELQKFDFAVVSVSIEKLTPHEADILIAECDVVGFGYPIYGSDVPQIMKEFMAELAPMEHKDAFIYCTQWMWSGDGARTGADFLINKGCSIRWAEHILMPNNVCVAITPFLPYTNDQSKINKKLAKAAAKLKRFAERIAGGRSLRRGFNPISKALGYLQRGPFRVTYHRFRNDINVDMKNCTRCGTCVRLCPAGNLLFDGNTFETKGTCILCLRCYNFCPESAITYMNRPHNAKRGKPYKGPVAGFNPQILRESNEKN